MRRQFTAKVIRRLKCGAFLPLREEKKLVDATFPSVLGCGDCLNTNAPSDCLFKVEQTAEPSPIAAPRTPKSADNLSTRRLSHRYVFISKAILAELSYYLSVFLSQKHGRLRSQDGYYDCASCWAERPLFSAPSTRNICKICSKSRSWAHLREFNSLQVDMIRCLRLYLNLYVLLVRSLLK